MLIFPVSFPVSLCFFPVLQKSSVACRENLENGAIFYYLCTQKRQRDGRGCDEPMKKYSSLFTESSEMPINTGLSGREELL